MALPLLTNRMGRSILILEDDAILRRQLGRVFAARGCEVVETDCVADFVDAALDRAYDACLLDLWLPDGNGLDAWEHVRASQDGAVTVVMSGEATPAARARAEHLGCADLLAKPFDLTVLLAAYEPVLGAQSPNFSIR
jgi:DNA-binding NtrC family response regulator